MRRAALTLRTAIAAALGLACGGKIASDPDGGSPRVRCVDPQPVIVAGRDTGFDVCTGGASRRRAVLDCPAALPRPGGGACPSDAGVGCRSDADCTEKPFGICASGGRSPCACRYGCVRDADCPSGAICACADPVGACVRASCTSGAACGPGLDCVDYVVDPGCPGRAFACESAEDTCLSDADCASGLACAYASGRRVCSAQGCAVGRPFLVRDRPRLAPAVRRSDWARDASPDVRGLSRDARRRLARRWTAIARAEHASIAAFARFSLELLALGAPPELVHGAAAAMADEARHAELAFGLASAYAGAAVGPAPLATDGALDGRDLGAFVRTLVREGCVGEAIAAVEAEVERDEAADAVVQDALATIARDEARHALLAWRTLAWLVAERGARALALGELRQALREPPRSEIARATLDLLVAPLARALQPTPRSRRA